MDFERVLLIVAGMCFALWIDWCFSFWRNAENNRHRQEAEKVLAAHGMSTHSYLATVGIEEEDLRAALDRFAFTGHIILDRQGNVIGKLLPKIKKGPHLRLVVDNSK